MPHGQHWEWRGFGAVKSSFISRYCELPVYTKLHEVKDLYLWIPGLNINTKFRTGAEGGLKIKRPQDKDGALEKWYENPEEIFDFPLSKAAWKKLSAVLNTAQLHLPDYPDRILDRATTLEYLQQVGCQSVVVHKHRESRHWDGPNGGIFIEWTALSKPQSLISIGIENNEEFHAAEFTDKMAKADLQAAIDFFELDGQPLHVMNYMEALKIWGDGQKI